MTSIKKFIGNLPSKVPDSVLEALRGTTAGEAGKRVLDYFQSIKETTVLIQTNGGTERIELLVPEGSYPWMEIDRISVYEPALTYDLYASVGTDSVLYDVGAHFGYYTQIALAAGAYPENIFAFESDGVRFGQLQSVHENDSVSLYNSFVGDGESDETLALDTVAASHVPPTIVKIDVEGAEYDVIRGMSTILEQHSPILYIELHPQVLPQFDTTVAEVLSALQETGYEIYMADHREQGEWEPAEMESLPTYDPTGKDYANPENTYSIKAVCE